MAVIHRRDVEPQLGHGTAKRTPILWALPGLAVFVAHGALFKDWLVDDAGISLAYARNLASGHGLVSQPGVLPVEGFSNPLWTLLLSGLFFTHVEELALAVKLLSLLLVAIGFAVIARTEPDRTDWSRGWRRCCSASTLPSSCGA